MCDECDWEDWLSTIRGAISMADDLPERAEDFADSVKEKLESIEVWVEENKHITDSQQNAVANMEAGIGRWMK